MQTQTRLRRRFLNVSTVAETVIYLFLICFLLALMLGVTTMTFDSVTELDKIFTVMRELEDRDAGSAPPPTKPDLVLRLRVPDDHSTFRLGYEIV